MESPGMECKTSQLSHGKLQSFFVCFIFTPLPGGRSAQVQTPTAEHKHIKDQGSVQLQTPTAEHKHVKDQLVQASV